VRSAKSRICWKSWHEKYAQQIALLLSYTFFIPSSGSKSVVNSRTPYCGWRRKILRINSFVSVICDSHIHVSVSLLCYTSDIGFIENPLNNH